MKSCQPNVDDAYSDQDELECPKRPTLPHQRFAALERFRGPDGMKTAFKRAAEAWRTMNDADKQVGRFSQTVVPC